MGQREPIRQTLGQIDPIEPGWKKKKSWAAQAAVVYACEGEEESGEPPLPHFLTPYRHAWSGRVFLSVSFLRSGAKGREESWLFIHE